MIWVFFILFVFYFLSMLAVVYGFKKVSYFSSEERNSITRFSIVIPFRNEAENLPDLLKTINELNYPSELFEIIFVNDVSEDVSEEIIYKVIGKSKFSIKLIQNKRFSNSAKKDAISEAIKNSKFEWIVTTDADCELPKNWLKTLDCFIQKNNPILVCSPVLYESNGSFTENFQQLDGLSLQAVTIGSFGLKIPMLSNGANLAYSKASYSEVNGFSGNDHIASGDDIFLMEKMKKAFPKQIHFLKSRETIVSTKPQKDWKNTVNQRIRWASKTSKQKNAVSFILGILVILVNISVLALPFFMVFDAENVFVYASIIWFKIIMDFIVIRQSARFFGEKISFWKFLVQPFVYASIILLVILGSFRRSYSWKGRTFENR